MGESSPWVDHAGSFIGGKVDLTTVSTRRLAGQISKRGCQAPRISIEASSEMKSLALNRRIFGINQGILLRPVGLA